MSGWQEQLVLTMTCEDGVSVTHTLDGEFAEANQAEKALANLRDGVTKLGQTIYYAREVQVNLPPLFVPNSLLNQLRRETAEMLDEARLNAWQRGTRKPVSVPPPVYPETHLSFLANVYNHKARAFYQRYGVQLIDAAYEAHEEKGDVPVMITKHCLRFAFNLCPKQAKGSIKSWKATPMQLIHGDEVLTLKFDCRPCEMHVVGKIKNHILKMPHPGICWPIVRDTSTFRCKVSNSSCCTKRIAMSFAASTRRPPQTCANITAGRTTVNRGHPANSIDSNQAPLRFGSVFIRSSGLTEATMLPGK